MLLRKIISAGRVYGGLAGLHKFLVWAFSGGLLLVMDIVASQPAFFAAIFVMLVAAVAIFTAQPIGGGIHTPRYLQFFKLPLRRLRWNFNNYLGLSAAKGRNLKIGVFQCDLKLGRGGALRLLKMNLVSHNNGKTVDLKIKTTTGYHSCCQIESIPPNETIHVVATFSSTGQGGIPVEDFLRDYSGFTFNAEFEGISFSREFTRQELEAVVDSFRKYSNPPPKRQPVLRDN